MMRLLLRPNGVRQWNLPNTPLARRLASTTTALPKLDLVSLDKKWQKIWAEERVSGAKIGTEAPNGKSYILPMFPYPSGTLHMGHLRVYTISDVLARYKRMSGYSVLHPMGWDAFGLPAENAAIERGINPADWTLSNIEKMKTQLEAMGADFNWEAELTTCSPDFYKHTQRIFLMLYERGLAYQEEALVNYDPVDKTVLANEQVDANGCSWRSGAKVEKLNLKQWFLRITAFREALLQDLDTLTGKWPERVLSQQRNWIGKSVGANLKFKLLAYSVADVPDSMKSVQVFTTRPDTLFGVHFVALALTHPLVQRMAETMPELKTFIEEAANLPPGSKAGFRLPGVEAVNPLAHLPKNGAQWQDSVPVFAAPYVLGEYGEGAVMGVPAHDSRDAAFWAEHGDGTAPTTVIAPSKDLKLAAQEQTETFTGSGYLTPECGSVYGGMSSLEATTALVNDLKAASAGADFAETWRLRDWLISRQRYWGTPIPIIHCDDCGSVPVPVEDLPVELPKIEGEALKGKSGNPLETATEWVNTTCPTCQKPAKRDTDTMDTFVDSSWYYMRFPDSQNTKLPFSPDAAASLPVNTYIGGVEHAILHLLYARFIYKFLSTTSLFPVKATPKPEPFSTLIAQGMVHGKTFSDPSTGRFLLPAEVDTSNPSAPIFKTTGEAPQITFEKMSKSKHNGVDPVGFISEYGADATRAHILFQAPVSEVLEWDGAKIVGITRWYQRLWRIVTSSAPATIGSEAALPASKPELSTFSSKDAEILLLTESTIKNVTQTMNDNPYGLNTVVSDLIKLTNGLEGALARPKPDKKGSAPTTEAFTPYTAYTCLSALLRLLAPVAPAFASECWELVHQQTPRKDVFSSSWPAPLLSEPERKTLSALSGGGKQTCAVQINGKLRLTVDIEAVSDPSDRDVIAKSVMSHESVVKWLTEKGMLGKEKRVIVVGGGKVVNVVF